MPPSTNLRSVTCPDGTSIVYRWRRSARARHIGLRIGRDSGLTVTLPCGTTLAQADAAVQGKAAWIAGHLARLAALPPSASRPSPPLPREIALPAVGECWLVEYRESSADKITIRSVGSGRLLLCGAVADEGLCRRALRRWLAERGEVALLPWLWRLAGEGGFSYGRAQVRGQQSRWGSCSARGTISLNWHLLFLQPQQVRYVLLHELCHTVELNHSPRFWQLLQRHAPDSDALQRSLRRAWEQLPEWLHEGRQPHRVD